MKMVMIVCTSIATVTSPPCPGPGICRKYIEDCVDLTAGDVIPALYRLVGIRQRTAANRVIASRVRGAVPLGRWVPLDDK
jgi:hypothetical protein